MAIIYDNDFESILNRLLEGMADVGLSTSVGSIVRLFTSVIAKEFDNSYKLIDDYMLRCFLSTSYGNYLDAIGFLLNCERLANEEDDDYKNRISKQILLVASANETAIRYAALQVEGVASIKLNQYTYGPGSFTLVVVPENIYTNTDYDDLINNVFDALADVVAYGTKYTVQIVNYNFITMDIVPEIKSGLDDVEIEVLKLDIQSAIKEYISKLDLGEKFIIDKLTNVIMNTNENIIDYSCSKFIIDGENVNFVNQETTWCSKFESDVINIL